MWGYPPEKLPDFFPNIQNSENKYAYPQNCFFWFFPWNFCHPLRKKMGGNPNYFSGVTRPNLWLARKVWVPLTSLLLAPPHKFCDLAGTHPAGAPFPPDLRSRAKSSILAARWKHLDLHKPWSMIPWHMIPRISSGALAHHQCTSLPVWFHYTLSYNTNNTAINS